jgi:hypothetical protein
MMKVIIFRELNPWELTERVNNFMSKSGIIVLSTQYTHSAAHGEEYFSVLIQYSEVTSD